MKKSFKLKDVHSIFIAALFFAAAIFSGQSVNAATRTWDGGGATNNWSEAANWVGDVVPEINDAVVFNGTSSKSCVIDITFVAGVNSLASTTLDNAFTGTVSVAPGLNLTYFGNLTVRSGTFALADGTFNLLTQLNLNGGAFNTGSGTANLRLLFQNGGTFNGSTGDVVFDSGIVINDGTFNASSGTNIFATNASQNFTQTGGIFNGNGTIDINGVFQLTGGTFNASSGNTFFGAGFVHTTGGTFNHSNGTAVFDNPDDRAATVSTNGNREIFNNVTFNTPTNNAAFTFANPVIFQVNGQLQMLNGVINSSFPSSPTNGLELRGNVTIGAGADGGTTVMRFTGTANQTITNNGGVNPTNKWTVDKTSGVLSLASDLTLGSAQIFDITAGEFSQGASNNLTVGTVNVGAGGLWRNNGTGDITLGGDVTNAGEIDIDGITISCNEADLILIRSTVNGSQRGWSGTGSFFVQDADVRDQAGTASITTFAGTNTGNNGANWTFDSNCSKFVWDGGGATNNWTEAANWRRNLVPVNSLVVYFDATSSKNSVIDASLQVNGVRIESGYTGTISHLTNTTLLVVGSGTGTQGFIQNGGVYTAGLLQVFGDTSIFGGTFSATSAQKDFLGNLTVSNAGYTGAGITKIGGNLTVTSPTFFSPGPRIEFNRDTTSVITVPANTQFDQFVIDKSTETASVDISAGSSIVVNGSLVLVGGQLNGDAVTVRGIFDVAPFFAGGTGTVAIQNPSTGGSINGGVLPQSIILNSPNAFVSVSTPVTQAFFQNFTLQNGTLSASTANVVFSGNYSQSGGTFQHGFAPLTFDGSFTLTGGNFQNSLPGGATISMNGDVFLNGGTFTSSSFRLFINNDFRINGSTFNHNNGTVIFNAPGQSLIQVGTNQLVFNNVSFISSSLTFLQTLDGTSWMTANGTASFNGGGFEKLPASPAIPSFRAEGSVSMSNFNFNTPLSLLFQGSSNQSFTQTGGFNFNGWTVNKTGGTLNLAQDTTINTLFLQNGTITTGANILTPASVARTNGFVIGNLRQNFDSPANKIFDVGTANGYSPVAVNAVSAAAGSSLTISATQSNRPGMNAAQSANRFWTLTETGDLTADLTFNYLQTDVSGDESTYKLYKWNGMTGTLVASILDTTANTISAAGISEFSDWTIGNLVPSAASVTVSGRVLSNTGRGIYKARVTLIDSDGNGRGILTNPFGFYRFEGVSAGQNYVISVAHKAYQFADPSRIIFVADSVSDVDFIAFDQTAANNKPSISGRVTDAENKGLANIIVELSNANFKEPLIVKTDEQGFYQFENLSVGETYFLNVHSKTHNFRIAFRAITLLEDTTNADFAAEEK